MDVCGKNVIADVVWVGVSMSCVRSCEHKRRTFPMYERNRPGRKQQPKPQGRYESEGGSSP